MIPNVRVLDERESYCTGSVLSEHHVLPLFVICNSFLFTKSYVALKSNNRWQVCNLYSRDFSRICCTFDPSLTDPRENQLGIYTPMKDSSNSVNLLNRVRYIILFDSVVGALKFFIFLYLQQRMMKYFVQLLTITRLKSSACSQQPYWILQGPLIFNRNLCSTQFLSCSCFLALSILPYIRHQASRKVLLIRHLLYLASSG